VSIDWKTASAMQVNSAYNSVQSSQAAQAFMIAACLACYATYNGLSSLGPAKAVTLIGPKIVRQMAPRGWSQALIDDTIDNPAATRPALNKATGQDATAYFRSDGSYVVRDNATNEILQVSNRNDPTWIPDSSIQDPYKP